MRSTLYLTASAFAAFASAQLTTKCNPMVNETGSCPDNPAISASFETDFKKGKDAVKGWDIENWSVPNYAPTYAAEGVELTVSKKEDVPVLRTQGYFLFGKIEVRMKAAPGAGIVSSVVLASADLDEVDWEWLGGFPDKVQTNYFGKGNATTFDRVTEVPVKNQEFHTYALDWTKEKLDWIIDDKVVRTLKYADAVGGKNYPQTPCTLGFGPWAAGDSENEGTSQWAGGKVDWSKGPYTQTIEWVKITNYSPGSAYKWKDQSGSWESIEVVDAGNEQGAPVNTETATPSSTAAAVTEGIGSHPTATSAAEGDKPTTTKEGEQPVETGVPGETGNPGYGDKPTETGNPGYGQPTETPSTSCTEGEKPTPTPAGDEPCDCDVETTTVTGYPPESTSEAPPPPPTTDVSPPPPQTTSDVPPPPETYAPSPPPETSAPPPPPPETSAPPPPAVPTGNTTSPPIQEFPGAATHNTAGALFGLVGAVMLMAF
ncbi:glycoside hydrolase family 16 protein [Lentithecium fluviatile CBS 122367]|uniref:chitinase n=1 Tax=Lentithecium fluviatile CBS 122367 TaxID=1168545 RepID=A0A6G1IQW5_9PLEO|nr:glycoside hydrolase family 16 protein [Lentithecium fluviatile CBS 122367]